MSNENKFTPWTVDDQRSKPRGAIYIRDSKGGKIARISQIDGPDDPREVADMLAAAPDLLGALLIAKKCLKENRGPSMVEFKQIQAAITKAIN